MSVHVGVEGVIVIDSSVLPLSLVDVVAGVDVELPVVVVGGVGGGFHALTRLGRGKEPSSCEVAMNLARRGV